MGSFVKLRVCLLLIIGLHLVSGEEKENQVLVKKVTNNEIKALKTIFDLTKIFLKGIEVWSVYESLYNNLAPSSEYEIRLKDERLVILQKDSANFVTDMKVFQNKLLEKLEIDADVQNVKRKLEKIIYYFTSMETFHERFDLIVKNRERTQRNTIDDFVKSVVTTSAHGVNSILNHIHSTLLETFVDGKTIFDYFANDKLVAALMCSNGRSAQQNIHHFYQQVLLNEVKGYTMIIFAHRIIGELEGNTETVEEDIAEKRFYERMNSTFTAVKLSMSKASRDIWRCDPTYTHIEGQTYDKFGPVFQKYIMHESDTLLDKDKKLTKGCSKNCAAHKLTKQLDCEKDFCAPQKDKICRGNIRDCEFISDSLTVCPANDGHRRYEFIETGGGNIFGYNNTCENNLLKANSHSHYLVVHCSFCLCTCEDSIGDIKRYINLRPVLADTDNNKVVTGVRLLNENYIFHIQIAEGVLLPTGKIDESTVEWKPIESYTIDNLKAENGKDYIDISWNNRTICLDDLDSPDKNHVLTGIKFHRHGNDIKLAIRITPIDFQTGKLSKDMTKWHFNRKPAQLPDRSEKNLDNLDVPIYYHNNLPSLGSSQYLKLTTSDKEQDAGQNVIPFIDIQPIITKPSVPLSGAGLIHKSEGRSGGFLGLKVLTFDIESHLHMDEPTIKTDVTL